MTGLEGAGLAVEEYKRKREKVPGRSKKNLRYRGRNVERRKLKGNRR